VSALICGVQLIFLQNSNIYPNQIQFEEKDPKNFKIDYIRTRLKLQVHDFTKLPKYSSISFHKIFPLCYIEGKEIYQGGDMHYFYNAEDLPDFEEQTIL
jgi:hypothetical protein